MRRALALIALPAAAAAAGAQPLTPSESSRVNAVFARFTDATPGCALAVKRQGEVVFARGYGQASLELGVPITPRTVMDIGSTSKQITAASVALLALDGRLSLDDDVRKYVPELPDVGRVVTVRRLLSHTSGWRDYLDLMAYEGWDDRDHTTDADAMAPLVRQRRLNFPPGTGFRYSNTGFFLMSVVVKRVSGESLADFARRRIFEPLGMTSTHYLTDATEVIPGKATAYAPAEAGRFSVAMSDWEQIGDGGVQTTVEDLAKWEANYETGQVGGPRLIELLTTPTRLNDGTPVPYGLGLFVDEMGGLPRQEHGGSWAGYRAHLMRFPSKRVAVLLECNRADAGTMDLATGVSNAVLFPTAPPATEPVAIAGDARAAEARAGLYLEPGQGRVVRLTASGGSLAVADRTPQPLVATSEREYVQTRSRAVWRWVPDAAGGRWLVFDHGAPPDTLVRVSPAPATVRQADYVGRYTSAEAGTTWRVAARGDSLLLVPQRGSPSLLHAAFRDAFDGAGLLRFERDAAGRVVALTVTTRGVQALRFRREP